MPRVLTRVVSRRLEWLMLLSCCLEWLILFLIAIPSPNGLLTCSWLHGAVGMATQATT